VDASEFLITGLAGSINAGSLSSIVVTAVDNKGQPLTSYAGTVMLTSNDPASNLPITYTFTAADHGQHTFAGVRFVTSLPNQLTWLYVRDITNSQLQSSVSTVVNFDTSTLQIQVSGVPSPAEAFRLQSVMVSAHDTYGNRDYFGTMQFSATDPWSDLPSDYAFLPGDNGTRTFVSQVEFRTVGTTDLSAYDRDSGVYGKQAGIVIITPAVPACVLQPGGCCSDTDCVGVLFGAGCNVADRLCACVSGYKICRDACIPSASCCEHVDCAQPASAGSASCEGNSCTVHCPPGTNPHNGDCLAACYPPAGDLIQ